MTNNTIKLSIIIVNYNVAAEIQNSIITLKKLSLTYNYEIIVVDNNSTEQLIKDLPSKFPDVKFIYLHDNLGYGPANNVGVENSQGEFILILNPDTLFIEDCISPLICYIESESNIGAVTPMLVYQDNTFQYSFGLERGVLVEYLDCVYVFNNFYEKIVKRKLDLLISMHSPFEVGWISGAFMLMKKSCFDEVNGFSREYKLNYEDMDLCFKLRSKGYHLVYFPDKRCVHIESVSQRKEFYNYIYYRYKGRLYFLKNHFSAFNYYLIRFSHIFGLFLRILFSFFIYKGFEGKERRKAFWDSVKLYLTFNN